MDPELPKPKFIREVALKIMRLSYHQRIVDILPDEFEPLLPIKPAPHYKYEEEGAGSLPGTMVAHKLMQAVKSKCTPEEALEILRELPNPMDDDCKLPIQKMSLIVHDRSSMNNCSMAFFTAKCLGHLAYEIMTTA